MKALFAFVVAVCVTAPALAQTDLEGRLHLSLESKVLALARASSSSGGESSTTRSFSVGYPLVDAARIGYMPGERFEFGGLLGLSIFGASTDGAGNGSTNIELGGYMRFVARGQIARFFVGSSAGFRSWSSHGNTSISGRQGYLELNAGWYGLITPSFTVDPFASFRFFAGPGEDNSNNHAFARGVRLAIGVALSGWVKIRNP